MELNHHFAATALLLLVLALCQITEGRINSRSSYDQVIDAMFQSRDKQCDIFLINVDEAPIDAARSCDRQSCDWPSEVCFQKTDFVRNRDQVTTKSNKYCKRVPDQCMRAAGGTPSGRPATRAPATRAPRTRAPRTRRPPRTRAPATASPITGGGGGSSSASCSAKRSVGRYCSGTRRTTTKKYYFNKARGRCLALRYRGCGGTKNRFDKLADCKSSCVKGGSGVTRTRRPSRPVTRAPARGGGGGSNAVCSLPKDAGSTPCNQRRGIVYYYDGSRCRFLRFSGCGGNGNNFSSISRCNQACSSGSTNRRTRAPSVSGRGNSNDTAKCKLRPSRGTKCKAWSRIWYYASGTCRQNWYGGCGGNDNRFGSKNECERVCRNV